MKQLDVGVSPPANIMSLRPTLTYLTLTQVTFETTKLYLKSFFNV